MPDYISPPSTLPIGSVFWVYLRDSGGDAQEQSVLQQRAELIQYCQRYSLVIAHIFYMQPVINNTKSSQRVIICAWHSLPVPTNNA
jgi:hypothetical protein